MPAIFEKLGIRFEYPENWTLDEEEARESGDSVTIYRPGGAFWSLSLQPIEVDPEELTSAAVETMAEEYEQFESLKASETIAEVELTGYNMNFYCLDLTNTAQVRAGRHLQRTLVILCQAEDREFEQIAPVFLAISTSLLR